MIKSTDSTKDAVYANYLIQNQASLRSVIVQWPYRAHLKLQHMGRTLDIGCGAGRNLKALPSGSIGIDHNELLVKACVKSGLEVYTTDEFVRKAASFDQQFDSILLSHVAEHMQLSELVILLTNFKRYLKSGGKIMIICPQEKGYATDSTHVQFMDFSLLEAALAQAGFKVRKKYSFPLPRTAGRFFPHNEFVVIGGI